MAIAATLAAILPAVPLGYALTRVNVPGRTRLWRVCRLGVLLPSFVVPLGLLVLAGPRGLVAGVFGPGGSLPGVVAIVIGQALGFFPHAWRSSCARWRRCPSRWSRPPRRWALAASRSFAG